MELTPDMVREIVKETVEELRKAGVLRSMSDIAYTESVSVLSAYYGAGETDGEISSLLESMKDDPYIKILPLLFRYGYTIESVAELFNVDARTIRRAKKRLCLAVYERLQ